MNKLDGQFVGDTERFYGFLGHTYLSSVALLYRYIGYIMVPTTNNSSPKLENSEKLFAEFGERFRLLREKLGLSQAELAAKLGYATYQVIGRIERGERLPNVNALAAFAELGPFNLHWLVTGKQSPDGEVWRSSYMDLLRTYDRLAAEVIDRLSVELADHKKERNELRERESRGDQTVPFGLADRLDADYIAPREAKIEQIKAEQKKALERYTGPPRT